MGIAESYVKGYLDIKGDIRELIKLDSYSSRGGDSFASIKLLDLNKLRNFIHEAMFSNKNISQAKKNAIFHYGRGTEMFRQYLDKSMTYTCAYWKDGTNDLDSAQKDKIDHTLRKLRLKPGMTMVDVGGGWGSVLFRAYEKYGVLGTNVSPTSDQNKAMRTEIKKRGLVGKIAIKECDFREDTGVYDRYVSLGVYEHAGYNQLEEWIRAMSNSLKPGGLGVLHFIGNVRRDLEATGFFIRQYIFPGGYLPGIAETLEIMDKYDLEILDVENLRRHYAKTLYSWGTNFDTKWDKIHKIDPNKYDLAFRRLWRFYLYACSATFEKSNTSIALFQITFSKGKTKTYPMTRDFLYTSKK